MTPELPRKEIQTRPKHRIIKYKNGAVALASILRGDSPALYLNGIEIGCGFDAILYKRSSFSDIPFGMPYFKLFYLIIKIYAGFNEKRWLPVLPA